MKKIVLIALLPLVFSACEKDEDTNPQFRLPTCDSLQDDGVFETYTQPETNTFLRFYELVPATEVPNSVNYVDMSSRKLYNNSIVLDPVFRYKQSVPTNLIIYLPHDGPEQYYSWIQNDTTTSDTLSVPIYNARKLNLPVGCHRLYYVFADTAFGKVLTKGHLDFEVIR